MADSQPRSPDAHRLRSPSWFDLRLVAGVLMVLVAILVGARVVASSDKSIRIWALARDVSAGTRLTQADLRQERIRLYGDAKRYLAVSTSPVGRTVSRELRAGDLLPGSALVPAPSGVVLPLAVDIGNVPPGLAHGDRIDVYVLPAASGRSGEAASVLRNAVVQAVSGLGGGGLAADNSKAAITVTVPAAEEDDVIKQLGAGNLYVVRRVGPQTTADTAARRPPGDPSSSSPATAGPGH